MQLFSTFTTLYALNLFNCINVFVPYYLIKGIIFNTEFDKHIEFNDDSKNVKITEVFPGKSQELTSPTHKVDAKEISNDIKDSRQKSSVNNSLDSGFSTNDPYESICFAEKLDVGEPLPLIYPNKDHTELMVNTEVLKVLESVPKPIYPVGVIGSVNSGKSLLVNLLNDNHFCSNRAGDKKDSTSPKAGNGGISKGFKMATTPEPETSGIWMYSKPVKMTRRRLQEKLKDKEGKAKKRFFSLKNFSATEGIQKQKVTKSSSSGPEEAEELDLDQEVNVVFIDIEGFSSHKNIYKYDEALFSMVSSICSEVIYLSNKTLDKSDLHTVEELIKSSLLSKISNLYTLYTGKGEPRENREEIFEYFLKIFENKNLTFLINEFDYTSKKAYENLVNLLKAPKRDLSLYEFFLYNLRKKKSKDYEQKMRELEGEEAESYENVGTDLGSLGILGPKLDATRRKDKNNVSLGSEEVKFNIHGYLFHTLFNSVNIATLPSTSKNELIMKMVKENKDKKSKGRGKNGNEVSEEDYLENLRTFKSELFQRSTRNPLKKYCLLDGVMTTCHMSGRDLAEMVKFTLSSLSLNRYYKLASSSASVELLSSLDYKDAFDQYFKMFRSTRLLMIKNDLHDTYKGVLKGYINGESRKGDKSQLGDGFIGFKSPGKCEQGCQDIDSESRLPTIPMLNKYSRYLKEKLMDVLVKNYENEAVPEDFDKIKTDLSHGLDRVSGEIEEELYGKLKNHCTNVSEALIQGLQKELDQLNLPLLPSRLKFIHDLSSKYGKMYPLELDGVDPKDEEFRRIYGHGQDNMINTLLSQSDPCDLVYEHYTKAVHRSVSDTLRKNEQLIEDHFYDIYNRAVKHFRTKFSEVEKTYDIPLDQALKSANAIMKESHNVMLTHLGEFHALDYLVKKYKGKLSSTLSEELELFKKAHKRKCSDKLDNIKRHYEGNYRVLLEKARRMPAKPDMLIKFRDYMLHLARSEFFRTSCSDLLDIEKRHKRFEEALQRAFKDSFSDNAKVAAAAIQDQFDMIDVYLQTRVKSSPFYIYFRYNAKRYAKIRLNYLALASRFNFRDETPSPQDALQFDEVLFDPECAKTQSSPLQPGVCGSLAPRYAINMNELATHFIRMEKSQIRHEFADAVLEEYLRMRMPAFRRMFLKRYCNAIVLVCSLSLLGMSVLSLTLAHSWSNKFIFSIAGLSSYLLLVGFLNLRRNLARVREFVVNFVLGTLSHFCKLCLMGVLRALGLVIQGIVYVIRRLGFLFTFFLGFTTAIIFYAVIYYKIKTKKNEERSK
ncbi:uncharacterized protein TOT_020000499 [Theileria orientalis strain Shintoku]|uniref:Guanylate-binding protein N-terminal domain-containing protein n=1 Tax=Theileria orientalis strain Shintoku TaxID=869250 RepID=J4C863_THEOR|nr:uncharacterized protein TOT_020000499 [Theileria orientalis strain Shintoku]BAM40238.1 uncharacterized protein TOT_020000499 [Theileria orientalis strain Shintoku]|eukprot:XP_009690539.1 uncharacterized protein TOT_020000499 [Theileria orientalis strain Shintoku]